MEAYRFWALSAGRDSPRTWWLEERWVSFLLLLSVSHVQSGFFYSFQCLQMFLMLIRRFLFHTTLLHLLF